MDVAPQEEFNERPVAHNLEERQVQTWTRLLLGGRAIVNPNAP